MEDNLPPTKGSLGRIADIHPGADGLMRAVTVRTATTNLKLPIVKICRLPLLQDAEEDECNSETF